MIARENRGFAFIKFEKTEDAAKAIEELDKTEFFDKTITVEVSARKSGRKSTPGKYLGNFRNKHRSGG